MNNSYYFLLIFLGFLVFCKILIYNGSIKKKKSAFAIKGYKVFYQDSKSDKDDVIESRLLSSQKYNVKGKPDYILKHYKYDLYIPIEIKSGKIGKSDKPHQGDFLQLITYFVIIEEEFGVSPKYGKLMYKDYMFIIKNQKKYRNELSKVLKQMRSMLKTGKCNSVNSSFNKCKHCLCNNTVCEVNKK